MRAQDFLDTVLVPNERELWDKPDDIRLAVNATLSSNAFFGILAVEIGEPDERYKDKIAAIHEPWRLVRDLSDALKHGELSHPKRLPRFAVSPAQMRQDELRLRPHGVFDDNQPWDQPSHFVFIEFSDDRVRAHTAISAVVDLARKLLAGESAPTITLKALAGDWLFG